MDFRKKAGKLGEAAAADFLKDHGMQILYHNYFCRMGEIDLIARDGRTYVVVEVKQRNGTGQGEPCEAVHQRKQQKICRTFDYFRMKHALDEYVPVRFDVIEVDNHMRCHWIKNAFEYQWP